MTRLAMAYLDNKAEARPLRKLERQRAAQNATNPFRRT
jgi:hypothetical protein